jgi:D-glycerate 3-kinase
VSSDSTPATALAIAATAIRGWAAEPDAPHPLVIGLCGAQGSGKSTLAAALADRLSAAGHRTAILALDDLYLPAADRAALAATVHPLLRVRGVPGTHDVEWGRILLDRLGEAGPVALPRFDKATDDRAASATVEGPFDVILFEGWCVGAAPQTADDLARPVNALETEADTGGVWRRHVNAALAGPYRALFARIDRLILLAVPGFEVVHRWRLQQEEELRGRKPDAASLMDAAAVAAFIQHYERLTRHILTELPGRADLTLYLDPDRRVIRAETKDISR